jgi:hypothetical protein
MQLNKILLPVILVAVLIFIIGVGVTDASSGLKKWVSDGVTFNFPSSWDVKDRENRFTSIIATLEYEKGGKSASIILEHDPVFSGMSTDVLETMLGEMYDGASVFESGTDKYVINNQSAPYIIGTFTQANLFGYEHNFVVLGLAIELGNYDAAFVQYVTDENTFDTLLGDAEQIIKSVKAVNVQTPI